MSNGEIRCVGLFKIYNEGEPNECRALNGVDLTIELGEFASIIGPSGSGKSTLLNLISCLDTPTRGEVYIEDVGISGLNGVQKARLRREKLGFVFQQFNLIPTMSAAENIELPMRFKGTPKPVRNSKVEEIIELVGLSDKAGNRPSELSGGQQQRVAVARSLANDPQIILADEPTGNLDQNTGKTIMGLLKRLNEEEGKTLVIVTHDSKIAKNARQKIQIVDGKIV
ncbi:MAG: ATP-binding cassette domain-containing protein [Candidatus Altiarchaeales archaeon]|nr:ATP-binding cassette domain-containing protein [Candidatus Altiarchaeales archaeon]MBD3416437.1 ATP-binding cassette domain-containing protein [Candidatus Altiarchaeales archaeon]